MKKSYYIFKSGRLKRKDDSLLFEVYENQEDQSVDKPARVLTKKYLPVENTEEFLFLGSIDVNTECYHFLGRRGICAHFFDYYGNYTGSFVPKKTLLSGELLIEQVKFTLDANKRMVMARMVLDGASFNILKNLKYYQNRNRKLEKTIDRIEMMRVKMQNSETIHELMGYEGNIRREYYQGFDQIVTDFKFVSRTKQPPQNEINALISLGNMLCYSLCLKQIHQTPLDPTISFLHEPGTRRFSLALDLAEIFKPILVDRMIFTLLNKKMIQKSDFSKETNYYFLKDGAKKTMMREWDDRLNTKVKHRDLEKNVRYSTLVRLEVYKMIKHIMGIETYKPFKSWW